MEPSDEDVQSPAAPALESAQSYLNRLYKEIELRSASHRYAGSEVWDDISS